MARPVAAVRGPPSLLKPASNHLRCTECRNTSNAHWKKHNFIVPVVKICSPAVVKVTRIANIPFFTVPMGAGSGFIIKSDGLIITNAHVVGNGSTAGVQLHDGSKIEAKVVGVDPARDIAVLKIDKKNLPVIPTGNPQHVQVGEWVLAMGSPLSLKNTVTLGIVSNLHRAGHELGLKCEKSDLGYIQTDATINVGNSGGPLVNLKGECVGINTMMASIGIAFALPIIHVTDFIDKLSQKKGNVSKPHRYIGLRMWTLTSEFLDASRQHIQDFPNVKKGVFVIYVEPDSPAANAGLKVHDVITAVDGKTVETAEEITKVVQTKDKFNLTIKTGKDTFDIVVEVEKR